MKILMLLFCRKNRGTFFRAWPWAQYLADHGHDVTVATSSEEYIWHSHEEMVDGVRLLCTPSLFEGYRIMARLSGMYGWGPLSIQQRYHEIVAGHYDIVHVFEHHPQVAVPALLAAKKSHAAIISDWCDHYGPGGFRERQYSPYRLYNLYRAIGYPAWHWLDHLERTVRLRADAVTVISTYLQQRTRTMGVAAENIVHITGSADVNHIVPRSIRDARKKTDIPEAIKVGAFLGGGQFDLDFCLDAFAIVVKHYPDSRFLIIGQKNEAVWQRAKELAIQQNIQQTGWVDPVSVGDYLSCANVCLLAMKDNPVNQARWPNKIGSYMAAARPTICTAVGDVAHLINDRDIGTLANVDPQDFADKIMTSFARPQQMEEAGMRARIVAEQEFDMAIQGRQLEQLYQRVLSNRKEQANRHE